MITVKLEDGRELVLQPVTPHEAMNIAEGCRHLSAIRQWWRVAMAVGSIRSIDGIPMPLPTHEKHVEGMVARFSALDLGRIFEGLESLEEDLSAPELGLVELTPLERLRIWAVIGEYETIPGWVAPAFVAAAVRRIDNEEVKFPTTKAEMKGLVARLGFGGMSRASTFLLRQNAQAVAADQEKQAAAKN